MIGPEILARSISEPTQRGSGSRTWQYHSRSDMHSKLACWTLLFDLLLECDVLRNAAAQGRIRFGINHVMVGPINKTLDLVVTMATGNEPRRKRRSFAELAGVYRVALSAAERAQLLSLPELLEDSADDVSEVAIALEAKACMTEHVKSLPRLHAEILATGYLAKLAAPQCILAAYALVNAARTFLTPSNHGGINRHRASDARRVVAMIREAIPTAEPGRAVGFDAVGVTVIECINDGSPVRVVGAGDIAPSRSDRLNYERMVTLICSAFRARFPR